MAVEVQMPSIGLSIPEGTIERWLKKEGDSVAKGELLVAITTEKVTVEIPAEVSGVLLKIICPAGTKVKVGQTIAIIGGAGEKSEAVPNRSSRCSPRSSQRTSRRSPRHVSAWRSSST